MWNRNSPKSSALIRGVLLVIVVSIFAAFPVSCSSSAGTTTPDFDIAASDKERNRHPDSTDGEIEELAAGNTEFALELYQAIRGEDGNLFYSPFSISQALAMTYAGARGETEAQMADTLNFTLPQARLHPAFNWLDLELAGRGEGAKGSDDGEFRLNIANSLWAQVDYNFLAEFLDTLAENYSAGVRLVDFVSDPETCRTTINRWVEEKTEDRIKELILPGIITVATRLVLVNAIYFNAAWEFPFPEETTQQGAFHTLGGGTVDVQMMHAGQDERMKYAGGEAYQALDIPYDAQELSMIILLPDEGEFVNFEQAFDAAQLDEIIDSFEERDVFLSMPKFEFEFPLGLRQTLWDMGMPIAFTDMADFSGMNGIGYLYIQDVVHKAFVSVNEAGTEAAAATAVIIGEVSAPMDPVYFTVDRPFIFLIRDNPTGSILFAGRMLNPAA